ncbi:MAG: hypothetical protein KGJ79_14745 [Alphaproteobacteria bacterium]|nr:hypothetical protein [Alphaproteobacteria bacterium]MDE2495325.1 hypothetical protein [Alphaproteobacteria bacterium]
MSSNKADLHASRLAPQEVAFLGLSILVWTAYVVWLGKDTSWDFRNYHWYIPYALLNGRLGIDVLVAHQASYYNPMMDVPFYWLAVHTPSWFAIGVLGLFQAANIVPLYILARHSLRIEQAKLGAAALSFFCMTGGLTLSLYGTHYYDNVMSLFVLTGLAILVVKREELAHGSLKNAALWCALAGFLTGGTAGLKLPEAPFAMGFAAALIAVGGTPKHQATRLVAGGLGGLAGFALFAGYWMWKMDVLTGNPLFPYFNEIFRSPLALASPYRDMRFLPTGTWIALAFPILFSIDWRTADDLPYMDIRVGLAYLLVIAVLIVWLAGRRSKDPLVSPAAARIMFAFAGVSYLFWLHVFAIYRYILALEMLAPILIVAAVALLPLPRRARLIGIGALLFLAMLFTRSAMLEHAPLGDPYITADLPKIPDPEHTMVVMTGDAPLGFIAPSLPPQIPVLRIDGWMVQPEDGTRMTRQMKARVYAHKGPLFLIADAYDMGRASAAVRDYGLAIDWLKCRMFSTNLTGAYQWCPLVRQNP